MPDTPFVLGLLREAGAEPAEAAGIVAALGRRLGPAQMRDWLAHPEFGHDIPDPEQEARWGVATVRTPLSVVARGRADVVLDAARRYGAEAA
jgi:hypothetical protein